MNTHQASESPLRNWDATTLTHLGREFPEIWASNPDIRQERLLIDQQGRYRVYFSPVCFTRPSPAAKVILLGLTPGLEQALEAARRYVTAPSDIREDPLALASLFRQYVAFKGSMRKNLCGMLDVLGLPTLLEIDKTESLFKNPDEQRLAVTSALALPVFQGPNLDNFSGLKDIADVECFRWTLHQLLVPFLDQAPNAVIVPFGRSVEGAMRYLITEGRLQSDRVLWNFPHPSGANAHRREQFEHHRDEMAAQLSDLLFRR